MKKTLNCLMQFVLIPNKVKSKDDGASAYHAVCLKDNYMVLV